MKDVEYPGGKKTPIKPGIKSWRDFPIADLLRNGKHLEVAISSYCRIDLMSRTNFEEFLELWLILAVKLTDANENRFKKALLTAIGPPLTSKQYKEIIGFDMPEARVAEFFEDFKKQYSKFCSSQKEAIRLTLEFLKANYWDKDGDIERALSYYP